MYQNMILSGLPGSGKSTLLTPLKALLTPQGWTFHSIGDFFKAKHRALHPNHEVTFDAWWPTTGPEINRAVNDSALAMMQNGKVLLDSRFSVAYRGQLSCLAVFLTAPLETRAQRAHDSGSLLYAGKGVSQIRQVLLKREQDEYERGKALFGEAFDYRESARYDLILDSGSLSVEQEVEQVKNALLKI